MLHSQFGADYVWQLAAVRSLCTRPLLIGEIDFSVNNARSIELYKYPADVKCLLAAAAGLVDESNSEIFPA